MNHMPEKEQSKAINQNTSHSSTESPSRHHIIIFIIHHCLIRPTEATRRDGMKHCQAGPTSPSLHIDVFEPVEVELCGIGSDVELLEYGRVEGICCQLLIFLLS